MKQTGLFLILFIFSLNFSAGQWIQQSSGTSLELNKTFFVNSTTGFVLGYNSSAQRYTLYRTMNGFQSKDSVVFSVLETVYGIFFLNSNTGWLTGSIRVGDAPQARIWKTTNMGSSWIGQTLPDTAIVKSVHFIDANVGYAVGNIFPNGALAYKTINGGASWTSFGNIISSLKFCRDVYFTSQLTGWIVGSYGLAENAYPTFIKTIDGGANWQYTYLSGWIYTILYHLQFTDNLTGYASGGRDTSLAGVQPYPRFFKTTNGGTSWAYQDLPWNIAPNIHFVNGMYFTNANTGWTVGDRGSIVYTTNGGTNWSYQTSGVGTGINLESVFSNSGYVWVTGNNGTILLNNTLTSLEPLSNLIPENFKLYQNFPNPFNPTTTIKFSVPGSVNYKGEKTFVQLKMFDIRGRVVSTLVNKPVSPGTYEINFDGSKLPSGVYLYKLQAGNFTDTKKLILIK
jgi:photosystem II stability/assembly factor-like uncharacterized protein